MAQRVQQIALYREAAALAAGVEVSALSGYWLADSATPADQRAGLVLGFAAVPEAQLRCTV